MDIGDVAEGEKKPVWSEDLEQSDYRKFHDTIKEPRFVVTQSDFAQAHCATGLIEAEPGYRPSSPVTTWFRVPTCLHAHDRRPADSYMPDLVR